jgi:hypothetical protein
MSEPVLIPQEVMQELTDALTFCGWRRRWTDITMPRLCFTAPRHKALALSNALISSRLMLDACDLSWSYWGYFPPLGDNKPPGWTDEDGGYILCMGSGSPWYPFFRDNAYIAKVREMTNVVLSLSKNNLTK